MSHIFSGQASLGLGDFGQLSGSANLQVPNSNNLLTTAIWVLGAITLFNTLVTVAVPFFTGKDDATPEETEEASARRMRNLQMVGKTVFEGIQNFAQKYQ